uniref:UPAR/Ly6 domain-containing protein n=1 Tax=Astatotilapia calliptera TaxID=8154 RepID=A0AAX7VCT4_ASTCA
MKTVIVAVLVLLVISQSEALKCYCGGLRHCPNSVETCHGFNNVCTSAIIYAGSSKSKPSFGLVCRKKNKTKLNQLQQMISYHLVFLVSTAPRYFKGCMKSNDCRIMNQPGVSSATCCSADLCNRY